MNSDSQLLCFINGEPTDSISVNDRGLSYGHGLFETIKISNKTAPLLRYHLERLIEGARIIGINADEALLKKYFYQLLEVMPEDGVIKMIVTAGSSKRGYFYNKPGSACYILQWCPLEVNFSLPGKQGVSLRCCQHRLPISPLLSGIKHLNRLDQVIARAEWENEFHDGLMLSQDGYVVECVSSNIFAFKAGVWITPGIAECGVAGVMRRYLIDDLFPSVGSIIEEVKLTLDDLLSADEAFICNSIAGILPVLSVDGFCSWPRGSHTQKIQKELYKVFPCYQ
jgi:4-amino-4-deoxychorismate lyase|tara:strand:- start:8195 stop:9040 length:846 start_codon:yes stop_codon:yes gene_type:complete